MKTLLLGILLGCLVATALFAAPQSGGRRETISLGSTDLTLGMSEDAIVSRLADSFNLSKSTVVAPLPWRANGVTSWWTVNAKEKGGDHGVILFASGKLSGVSKSLPTDDEVAFGRQLYFAMRDLELEGDSHCTIETENGEVPDFSNKTANLRCGKKTLVIQVDKLNGHPEAVGLTEGLETVPR